MSGKICGLGECPDTCYGVSIRSVVVQDGGMLEVTYKLREPREDEGCGDAPSYPLSLVAIEKRLLPIGVRLRRGGNGVTR